MYAESKITKGLSLNERLLGAKTPSKEGFISFELLEEEHQIGDILPSADKVDIK
jgi:hypothetical protein